MESLPKHLGQELPEINSKVSVDTKYGSISGGKASTGAVVFLEIPYALPPKRFEDPQRLTDNFRYQDADYIFEKTYNAQPENDGQAAGLTPGVNPMIPKVGLGKPSEDLLFLNIACPPNFASGGPFPVKVYLHGGFLQFGSPHALFAQAQYVSVSRSEVWVNIGYRLSAFGFLACDEPYIPGNFGFKDQWLAIEWIHSNISAFGGNSDDIQVIGLSAGAHSVHQLLHHASHLPEGTQAPFQSALLHSNAILTNPKTPKELRPQFRALCHALKLDPDAPDTLSVLKDPTQIPFTEITRVIETDAVGVEHGTYRGCLDPSWLPSSPDLMTWQRSGGFAKGLKSAGIRNIIVGDLTEEWYLYAIAHPISLPGDIRPNLERYYHQDLVEKMLKMYEDLPPGCTAEQAERRFGAILSDGQVHLPVRLLARDLYASDFPVLRYEIRWTPEQGRPKGYVTHASDRILWSLRVPSLLPDQVIVAEAWLDAIESNLKALDINSTPTRSVKQVLTLTENREIKWTTDERWEEMMKLAGILPGEIGGS